MAKKIAIVGGDKEKVKDILNQLDMGDEVQLKEFHGGTPPKQKIFELIQPYEMLARDMIGIGASHTPTIRKGPKVNRNDLCPCDSGLKYKKCCINH